MEGITKIATVNVVRSQRARWQSGHLAQEWRTRFPNLFDDDDLRLANSQPAIHFYEWLGAVVSPHDWLSVASREVRIRNASRKQHIVAQLLPSPVRNALRDRSQGRAQAPDLLMYAEDFSNWFFCEVKGRRDPLAGRAGSEIRAACRHDVKARTAHGVSSGLSPASDRPAAGASRARSPRRRVCSRSLPCRSR